MPVGFMTAVALVVRVVRFMLRGTAEEWTYPGLVVLPSFW